MQKTMRILSICLLFIAMASCGKTEKVLVKQDGIWNVDKLTSITSVNGGTPTTDSETNAGTITFSEDGTGIIVYTAGGGDSFDWEVDGDIITITFLSLGMAIDYDINESSKNEQVWSGSYSYDILGMTYDVDQEITLGRLD